jgi:iron complex outermembrane receptor protein
MMQVKTFEDVLRVIPGFHFTRTSNNLTTLEKPSMGATQLTSVHLYINDHDMSSSSFGTAFLIWGELPIEYIDHIEVYKGAASIEFGNETSTVIIKLYTKSPQREEGSKVRLYGDNYGSVNFDGYIASSDNDFSYFAYANMNSIQRKDYYNEFEGDSYKLPSDHSGHNLYANLNYKEWILELGSYYKKSDSFLGKGIEVTPTDGDLNTHQHYLHLTKKFENNIKLQLSYDRSSYDRTYQDPNGIMITNAPIINDYKIGFDDEIFSSVLEKKFKSGKHSFLVGGFVKNKRFTEYGTFEDSAETYYYSNSFANSLYIYSLYGEYTYDYDATTRVIASLKEDYTKYDKIIDSKKELSAKIGMIKYIKNLKIKAFITKTYSPAPFYQLYNPDNIPYKTNPDLDNMHIHINTLSVVYKEGKQKFKFVVADNTIDDGVYYNSALPDGYANSSETLDYLYLEFGYDYNFDINNKFTSTFFYGTNSNDTTFSPKYTTTLQLFSKYKKFDIYNEFMYRSSYTYQDLFVDRSYDYTAAIKYHYTKDLSFGLRGENIFDSGYKQSYRALDYAIGVVDQKVWFDMEYLF